MVLCCRKSTKNMSGPAGLNRFSVLLPVSSGFIRFPVNRFKRAKENTDHSNKPAGFPKTGFNRFFQMRPHLFTLAFYLLHPFAIMFVSVFSVSYTVAPRLTENRYPVAGTRNRRNRDRPGPTRRIARIFTPGTRVPVSCYRRDPKD